MTSSESEPGTRPESRPGPSRPNPESRPGPSRPSAESRHGYGDSESQGRTADLISVLGVAVGTDLLTIALTHSSFAHENPDLSPGGDNQRLEFLGDAVLQFCTGQLLYRRFRKAGVGELTRHRAALVSEEALCRVAAGLSLGDYLRLGRGEEVSGGRERASLLADAFEAIVGAIYLDCGVAEVERFVDRLLGPRLADSAGRPLLDAKTALQEAVQAVGGKVSYHVLAETGPDHDRAFTVAVRVDGTPLGQGQGRTKKEAERAAAAEAVAKWVQDGVRERAVNAEDVEATTRNEPPEV